MICALSYHNIGYIGGAVLYRLLQHPSAKTFDITALVRSPEKVKKLESFGVKGVVGSLDDYDLVEDLVSKAHVIIDTVSGFQLGLRFLADWHSFIIG